MPALYANVRTRLTELLVEHQPGELVYAPALIGGQKSHNQTKALNGVEAICLLAAYDYGVKLRPLTEVKARKAILRRPVRGADWKAAALAWCDDRGWQHKNDDNVADACVMWAFRQRLLLAGDLL